VQRGIRHPARLVPLAFVALIALGTLLLMLPAARADAVGAPWMTALFTATSAACVTGLAVVDTPTYWSTFGQGVILGLFQVGGFGIMTGATLLGLLVSRRLRLQTRLVAQAETRSFALGDVASVLRLVLVVTVAMELLVALLLAQRLHWGYGEPAGQALWNGVFHSVSAFNNAGFSTYSDSLVRFRTDAWVLAPVMLAIVVGGLGFPVLHELRREPWSWATWSVHAKITVLGTAMLLAAGTLAILLYEGTNPRTLGALDRPARLLNALFQSVSARTAGFNSLDIGALQSETLAIHYLLMFVGGGSAGTAGGIKVTTFFLLGFVVWAEVRGAGETTAFGRSICRNVQRQALAVVLLGVGAVGAGTLALLSLSEHPFERVAFEAVSAFATVGLSTGITADFPPAGHLVLVMLMFFGRVGTITIATALALRRRAPAFRYPEERPIVG
jgi:potassium uptake TrkH family protein